MKKLFMSSIKGIDNSEFFRHIPTIFSVLSSLFKLEYHNEPDVDSKEKLVESILLPNDT